MYVCMYVSCGENKLVILSFIAYRDGIIIEHAAIRLHGMYEQKYVHMYVCIQNKMRHFF